MRIYLNSPKNLLVYNLLHRIYDPPRRFHSPRKNISLTCQRCGTVPRSFVYSRWGCRGASCEDLATPGALASMWGPQALPHQGANLRHQIHQIVKSSPSWPWWSLSSQISTVFITTKRSLAIVSSVNPKLPNYPFLLSFSPITVSSFTKSMSLFYS